MPRGRAHDRGSRRALFDSNAGKMLTNQVVLINGERITEVGPAAQVRIPAGAQVIDLSRETVLPGLIDGHSHIFNEPKPGMSRETSTMIAIQHAQDDLRAGFTTLRDMTSHGNGYADVDVRNAFDKGLADGPRMQVSTRGIVWSGAPNARPKEPLAAAVVTTPDEARAAVRDQIEHGADWIKLYPAGAYSFTPDGKDTYVVTYPMPVLQALIDETHRLGKKTACHVYGGDGQKNAIIAGCDTIEHGFGLNQEQVNMMAAKKLYLRSDAGALHRALYGRQRQEVDRRQVPHDPDLREGRSDGGGDAGHQGDDGKRRRRLDLSARHAGARFRVAGQARED